MLDKQDLEAIKGLLQPIEARLAGIDARLDRLETRVDRSEIKVDELSANVNTLKKEVHNNSEIVEKTENAAFSVLYNVYCSSSQRNDKLDMRELKLQVEIASLMAQIACSKAGRLENKLDKSA